MTKKSVHVCWKRQAGAGWPGAGRPAALPRPVVRALRTFAAIASTLMAAGVVPAQSGAQTTNQTYTFTTLAGQPETGPGWYDGVGASGHFTAPSGLAADSRGNIYVADMYNSTIRKVSSAAVVTTVAGLATSVGSADGIGSVARFNYPQDVAVDSNDNLYVADTYNHTIRQITPTGTVTTVAGLAGTPGSADATGSEARFNYPVAIAVSGTALYIVDTRNQTIRKMTLAGVVSTLAGSPGLPGKADGTGTAAQFNSPQDIVVDPAGNLYVADGGNHVIRKITAAGVVTTLAGLAGTSGSADGTGAAARFNYPCGLAWNGNNLVVVDTYNQLIRNVTSAGVVTTSAGLAETPGTADGPASAARFNYPLSALVGADGTICISDTYNHTLRKMDSSRAVTTFVGLPVEPGSADGARTGARFNYPEDVALDTAGNVYVADSNSTIRKITPDGTVSTLAGLAGMVGTADGTGTAARFDHPVGIGVDSAGVIYVADTSNHSIRKVSPAGQVSTFAGLAGSSGTTDGTGAAARFNKPFRLAVDPAGYVYVADTWNHTIRKITPAGLVSTLAGNAGVPGSADGIGTDATFYYPEGLALDADGTLFVADDGNHTIRKITPAGVVTTLAGKAGTKGSADGFGAAALFRNPLGLVLGPDRTLYVTDTGNHTIRKITSRGTVTTLAGLAGWAGNIDGTGAAVQFNSPAGLAFDQNGSLYVADAGNHTIRKGYLALPDQPTVDLPVGPVGTPRHLDLNHVTTTNWSWRVIRRPASSSAQLSSASTRNPTFTPDADDLYVLLFQGSNVVGRSAIGTLLIETDTVPPHLSIASPASGQKMTNPWLTLTGTAGDDRAVAGVWCELNQGPWFLAHSTNAWTNWAASFGLTTGTNLLQAYAVDAAGLSSATNTLQLLSTDTAYLHLNISPNFNITPAAIVLDLQASPGWKGRIEASSDFISWESLGNLGVTNGAAQWRDQAPDRSNPRFYRAVAP